MKTFRIPPQLSDVATRKRKRDKEKAVEVRAMPILAYIARYRKCFGRVKLVVFTKNTEILLFVASAITRRMD